MGRPKRLLGTWCALVLGLLVLPACVSTYLSSSCTPGAGETADQIREECGYPARVNRTDVGDGLREQWVYGSGTRYLPRLYVYFHGGRVVAVQSR